MSEQGAEVVDLADFGAARQSVWRMGYRSDDVELFQRRLIAHGFTRLSSTGVVDLDTAAAVRVLQKHFGLRPDGVISPDVRAFLDADEAAGAARTRAAGVEFSTPVNVSGLGDALDPGAGSALAPTAESPQTIQVVESAMAPIPFYKNPMVWLGVGGAALLIYWWTSSVKADENRMSDEGSIGLEDVDDPDAFFGVEAPRRRSPTRKKKPAAKRKPRKKSSPGVSGVDDAPAPKRKRRKRKALGETELGPDGNETPDPHAGADDAPADEEVGVAGPPSPRRRKRKAAGKRNAKGQFQKKK